MSPRDSVVVCPRHSNCFHCPRCGAHQPITLPLGLLEVAQMARAFVSGHRYCQPQEFPPMKIYLAARYSRGLELQSYAHDLREAGHTITSRWIYGNHQISDAGLADEAKAEERTRFAREDYEDILAADCVISFTEAPRSTSSRGGRHVEFGIALALGKRVIIIGPRENLFHALPQVEQFDSWSKFWTPFWIT